MENLKEKVERWKALAEIFLKENVDAFIRESTGNLYFGKIILVGEDSFTVECFGPHQRAGEKFRLFWPMILEFNEYKEYKEASDDR